MSFPWLANTDPATDWTCRTWSELAAIADKDRVLVVLPVHGLADHGMGLPLDVEETVGSAVLRSAVTAHAQPARVLVLPPLRLVAGPYAHCRFGVDAETALETLMELAASVKASGFARLLFFNTSPWNAELVSAAAIDTRVSHDLRTYVTSSTGLGLGFHPADPNRVRTQAVAARLLRRTPTAPPATADTRDLDFRPGYFAQPAPVSPDVSLDADHVFFEAAAKLASFLGEVLAHQSSLASVVPAAPALPIAARVGLPRELAAMTADELAFAARMPRALAIIPTGAVEQHGHHLPLGTDAMLNRLWLTRALAKLSPEAPVFVAPPITVGKSNEHLGFAGTLTISARTLRRQLLALATQLKALGFGQVAIFNTHGGNSPTVVSTVREMQTDLGLRAGILANYYRAVQSAQETTFGFHAGDWETSLMLAGAPDLVRMDRAVCEYPAQIDAPGLLRPEASPLVFAWKTSDISQSGVMGDATIATSEKGARWLEESSTALARKIESLL